MALETHDDETAEDGLRVCGLHKNIDAKLDKTDAKLDRIFAALGSGKVDFVKIGGRIDACEKDIGLVQKIVFGGVGLILVAVLLAGLALVIK